MYVTAEDRGLAKGERKDELLEVTLGGAYTVRSRIGTGGMGSVYLAEHVRLPKSFAVKVLNDSVDPGSELYHRFRREAEVCSRLKHEHIVEVVDFNITESGRPYIVMELLEGEDLATRLERQGPFSLEQTARILGQVASALGEAHEQGVVHRDMKPQNIFLCRRRHQDDYVKLVDFGISKIQGAGSVLTQTNSLMGTPFYMSPEQTGAGDGKVDHRTDIYALGVIAYQMLTGDVPFRGESFAQVVLAINMRAPGSMRVMAPQLPAAADAVVQTALAKDLASRFQTAADFDRAFQAVARGEPCEALPAQRASTWPPIGSSPGQPPSWPGGGSSPGQPSSWPGGGPSAVDSRSWPGVAMAPSGAAARSAGSALAGAPTTLSGATGQHEDYELPSELRGGPSRRLLWGLGIAGLAAVVLVAVLVVSLGGRGSGGDRKPPAAPGGQAAMAASQEAESGVRAVSLVASRVVVRLSGLPVGATCRVNGRLMEGNPLVLDRSERQVTLLCEAPGHQAFTHNLTPDKDCEVKVSMPTAAVRPREPQRRRPATMTTAPARTPARMARPMRPGYDDVPVD